MAQHRGWFHPRIDRDELSDPVALGGPCDAERLAGIAGRAPGVVERVGTLLLVDADGSTRLACRAGLPARYVGAVEPWRDGLDAERVRAQLERSAERRLDPVDGLPGFFRAGTVWRETTWEIDPERRRVVTWVRRLPVAYSLIELHRGRGATDAVVDATAVLAVVVGVSGVAHGLRYPGRRRRLLVALVVASAGLVLVLAAG
jgi:hypothetical protein